jgi:hypothetical protein
MLPFVQGDYGAVVSSRPLIRVGVMPLRVIPPKVPHVSSLAVLHRRVARQSCSPVGTMRDGRQAPGRPFLSARDSQRGRSRENLLPSLREVGDRGPSTARRDTRRIRIDTPRAARSPYVHHFTPAGMGVGTGKALACEHRWGSGRAGPHARRCPGLSEDGVGRRPHAADTGGEADACGELGES